MRSYRKTGLDRIFDVANYTLMCFIILVTLYPFYYIFIGSFSPIGQIIRGDLLLWPEQISIAAYKTVLSNPLIPRAYYNTLFITSVGTLISMVLTIMGAYVLSKKYLPGHRLMSMLIVFTMLFDGGLIPTYLTVKSLGFGESLWVLIIPSAINAFNMVVMRNFFSEIPQSLEESAAIDGASQTRILLRIFLPLSLPVIATVSLFYAVQYWNAFFDAIIYLNSNKNWPLQVVLREAIVQGQTEVMMRDSDFSAPLENVKMALIIVTVLPILCVYPFVQRYFVKGVMMGSVKG